MGQATAPLTWSTALASWRWDGAAVVLVFGLTVAYGWAWRRAAPGKDASARRHTWSFAIGIVVLSVATLSAIGVYDRVLFWVRALQVLLLLVVAPFFLAMCCAAHWEPLAGRGWTGWSPRLRRAYWPIRRRRRWRCWRRHGCCT